MRVTPVSDPYWADRLAKAKDDDEFVQLAWAYWRSSLAKGWPTTPEKRDQRRREVAQTLLRAAEQP